jgi:hypothetical protein
MPSRMLEDPSAAVAEVRASLARAAELATRMSI